MLSKQYSRQSHPLLALGLIAALLGGPTLCAADLEGRWRHGSWSDANTGHEGALKARFGERDDGNYRVVFTGRFAKIIPSRFATTLNVVGHDGDQVILAGESRLLGFGRFSYQAVGDGHHFHAQYSSRRWRGEFSLSR